MVHHSGGERDWAAEGNSFAPAGESRWYFRRHSGPKGRPWEMGAGERHPCGAFSNGGTYHASWTPHGDGVRGIRPGGGGCRGAGEGDCRAAFVLARAGTPAEDKWASGRLLVHGKDGKVQYSVHVMKPPPPEPCHPGCFPAGTAIRVPGGTKPIERVREGDEVTTVGPDGNSSPGKVAAVF